MPGRVSLEAVRRFHSTRHYATVRQPIGLRIPAIGVDSALQRLGRAADGTIEVPSEWDLAGWYKDGARPGEPGPAVILGHVDSKTGPAIFYNLNRLEPGDKVLVDQRKGDPVEFLVNRTEYFPKTEFPTQAVYFPTLKPVLRLVTCGGEFDESVGHYRDNVIVFASLTG